MTEPSTALEPGLDRGSPAAQHSARRRDFEATMNRLDRTANRYSMARLVLFIAGAALCWSGIAEADGAQLAAGGGALLGFFVAVVLHQRVLGARNEAELRRDIHDRHLKRLSAEWQSFNSRGDGLLPPDHAYAWDIDLLGPGSLFQRIDVTHTVHGERLLAAWLGAAAEPETIEARQRAVSELSDKLDFRQELEAAALLSDSKHKLDGSNFRKFAELPSLYEQRGWLTPVTILLPLCTLAAYVAGEMGVAPGALWLAPLALCVGVIFTHDRFARVAFDLAGARSITVEAFARMLLLVEQTRFESPALVALQERIAIGHTPPSEQMRRLRRWVGLSALRQQFLFHVFVNPLTLWDLHVLRGLEAWNRDVGKHSAAWFEALAELEALCSLASLAHGDPAARMPECVAEAEPFDGRQICHPLLPPGDRIANDVTLRGPGTTLVVTGSNMAGKSTLLRAVGLNIALALAGGPVCAGAMRVPRCRLRASMRAEDSLQRGASYFHAELTKLKGVVADGEQSPPILFLLDELLRGTNAHARALGAKAVVLHLLQRSASGLVATHDVKLAALEASQPQRVANVHFTDVVVDGEMRFDYLLRPGIVQTSNAMRLLAMVGIDVPDDDRVTDEESV